MTLETLLRTWRDHKNVLFSLIGASSPKQLLLQIGKAPITCARCTFAPRSVRKDSIDRFVHPTVHESFTSPTGMATCVARWLGWLHRPMHMACTSTCNACAELLAIAWMSSGIHPFKSISNPTTFRLNSRIEGDETREKGRLVDRDSDARRNKPTFRASLGRMEDETRHERRVRGC